MIHLFWWCLFCSAASPEAGSATANNDTAPWVTVETAIAALAQKVPSNLSELEAVLGPLHRDLKNEAFSLSRKSMGADLGALTVSFAIDFYHHDPYQQKNPAIKNFRQSFTKGFSQCREAFRKRFGLEKTYQQGARQVLRFDTGESQSPLDVPGYYLFHATGEGFDLAWSSTVLDFAIPTRTGRDEAALTANILSLLKERITRSRIESIFGKLNQDRQVNRDVFKAETFTVSSTPSSQESPTRFTILFGPPLPGKALLRALGIQDPVAVSTDVHMTSRVIADYKTHAYPVAGGFTLYLHVSEEGLKDTNLKWPASGVWKAGAYQILSIEGMVEDGR